MTKANEKLTGWPITTETDAILQLWRTLAVMEKTSVQPEIKISVVGWEN